MQDFPLMFQEMTFPDDPVETPDAVTVPETPNLMVPSILQEMCEQVHPLEESLNYGIDLFMQAEVHPSQYHMLQFHPVNNTSQ